MKKIILYHGSANIIAQPIYGAGKPYNDYGRAFYCTEHIELAKEWACNEGIDGYANKYELDTDGLSILDLSDKEYTILNWLAILLDNRTGRAASPVEKRGKEYLLENFLPEYRHYDIIIGYRADDSYFSFARAFLANTISLSQLSYAMRLGKLGEQYAVVSELAFSRLRFIDCLAADNTVYYHRRKSRDNEARVAFHKEMEKDDMDGIFLRDIIREGMRADDARLRQYLS